MGLIDLDEWESDEVIYCAFGIFGALIVFFSICCACCNRRRQRKSFISNKSNHSSQTNDDGIHCEGEGTNQSYSF